MTKSPLRNGIAAVLCLLIGLAGCSKNDGPERFTISGKVTYGGKPVPKGFVTFSPVEGNSGPGGGAEVRDGHYSTPAGKGIIGGMHDVRIIGFDGVATTESGEELADGKPLFPTYIAKIDFAKEDATRDFEVLDGSGEPEPSENSEEPGSNNP